MVDESPVDNKSSEMSPQEDGTKVPLNDDGPTANIEQAKFVSNPNGEAKIDVGVPPTFTGLTKEELMKYSNDPFWVRLRWFLFVVFWLGWLAMLVVAIVIIVQAPGCKPPPELLWVEEYPAIHVDSSALPSEADLLSKCEAMGVKSVYFPDLINLSNFQEMNYEVKALITAVVNAEKNVVTDLPLSVARDNPFYQNASAENLINSDGTWNYENEKIASTVFSEIVGYWIAEGVKGFLMETVETPEEEVFKNELNGLAKEVDGAVGSDIVDTKGKINTPSMFRSFLEDYSTSWTFNKFNPTVAVGSSINEERLKAIGLFLTVGTPLIKYETSDESILELIKHLSDMKSLPGIKFGTVEFTNSTEGSDTIAYTRVQKGTPAYAIALNFNDGNATVTFEGTANIGETGIMKINSKPSTNEFDSRTKYELNNVELGPYEGMVLEFVADI